MNSKKFFFAKTSDQLIRAWKYLASFNNQHQDKSYIILGFFLLLLLSLCPTYVLIVLNVDLEKLFDDPIPEILPGVRQRHFHKGIASQRTWDPNKTNECFRMTWWYLASVYKRKIMFRGQNVIILIWNLPI